MPDNSTSTLESEPSDNDIDVLYDEAVGRYLIARDPIGIIPLYYGFDDEHQLYVASEMKALVDVCNVVSEFPPGHYWASGDDEPTPYYRRPWQDFSPVEHARTSVEAVGEALENAVVSHLMTDVPYGVLLSGGLDSSIIAAVTQKHVGKMIDEGVPMNVVKRVLYTCEVAGYGRIRLAIGDGRKASEGAEGHAAEE